MRSIKLRFSFIIAIFIVISGCSNKPKLYGNDSCGPGKTAYVYSNGFAAICLNEDSVAYMVCARELGIITAESKESFKSNISTNAFGQGDIQGGVENEQTSTVTHSQQGPLAKATAKAIETCITIHKNYR